MRHTQRSSFTVVLVLLLTLASTRPAGAQFDLKGLGPSGAQVTGVLIGAGVIIGVGIYLIARSPRVTGCVRSSPSGLDLQTEQTSPRSYTLLGKTAGIIPNQRIKVSGRRRKLPAGERVFTVESLKKVYGPCNLVSAGSPSVGP